MKVGILGSGDVAKSLAGICGNDDKAKAVVRSINEQFGWETADKGNAQAARAIEPLCMLWCFLGFTQNEWARAFKLLHAA
jgi:predicted dinucleotide-binding enzyme